MSDGETIFSLAKVEHPSLEGVLGGPSSLVSEGSFFVSDEDDDAFFDFLVDDEVVICPNDEGDVVIDPEGPEADA